MECPNCIHETNDPLTCAQCGSSYCSNCQPEWDYQGDVCSHCSERNTIAALKDDAWTAKLRRWFSKKIEPPVEPVVGHGLPWSVQESGDDTWWIMSEGLKVASFTDRRDADHACKAANQHYQLCGLAVLIHNRIRAGDAWFRGSEEDCNLWAQLKTLLK